jgi:hypothetical protein
VGHGPGGATVVFMRDLLILNAVWAQHKLRILVGTSPG